MAPVALTILVVFAIFVIAVLAVWVIVTAWRILSPERPLPFVSDPARRRRERTRNGEAVPVGFREIHEDMPDHAASVRLPRRERDPIEGAQGSPEARPSSDSLWYRRN